MIKPFASRSNSFWKNQAMKWLWLRTANKRRRLLRWKRLNWCCWTWIYPSRTVRDVLGLINSQAPLLPVVIITGMRRQLDTTLIPGISAFMEKPVDVPSLLAKISEVLNENQETRLRWLRMRAEDFGRGALVGSGHITQVRIDEQSLTATGSESNGTGAGKRNGKVVLSQRK